MADFGCPCLLIREFLQRLLFHSEPQFSLGERRGSVVECCIRTSPVALKERHQCLRELGSRDDDVNFFVRHQSGARITAFELSVLLEASRQQQQLLIFLKKNMERKSAKCGQGASREALVAGARETVDASAQHIVGVGQFLRLRTRTRKIELERERDGMRLIDLTRLTCPRSVSRAVARNWKMETADYPAMMNDSDSCVTILTEMES